MWNKKASCTPDSTIFWKTAFLNSLILYLILHPYFENNTSLLNTAQSSLYVILHIKDKGWRGQLEFIALMHQCKFSYPKKLCRTIRRNNFELKESHQEIIQTEKHTQKCGPPNPAWLHFPAHPEKEREGRQQLQLQGRQQLQFWLQCSGTNSTIIQSKKEVFSVQAATSPSLQQ